MVRKPGGIVSFQQDIGEPGGGGGPQGDWTQTQWCVGCVHIAAGTACTLARGRLSPTRPRSCPQRGQVVSIGALADGSSRDWSGRGTVALLVSASSGFTSRFRGLRPPGLQANRFHPEPQLLSLQWGSQALLHRVARRRSCAS